MGLSRSGEGQGSTALPSIRRTINTEEMIVHGGRPSRSSQAVSPGRAGRGGPGKDGKGLTDGIDVAPVGLHLGVLERVAVNLAGAGEQEPRANPLGQPKHVERSHNVGLVREGEGVKEEDDLKPFAQRGEPRLPWDFTKRNQRNNETRTSCRHRTE